MLRNAVVNKRPPSVTSAEMREDAASMRRKITEDMRADLEKDKQKMTKVGEKKDKNSKFNFISPKIPFMKPCYGT